MNKIYDMDTVPDNIDGLYDEIKEQANLLLKNVKDMCDTAPTLTELKEIHKRITVLLVLHGIREGRLHGMRGPANVSEFESLIRWRTICAYDFDKLIATNPSEGAWAIAENFVKKADLLQEIAKFEEQAKNVGKRIKEKKE